MQQDHRKDFEEAISKIKELDSYAISRCADGEASVLKNITVGNKDGWLYKKDKNLIFRAALRKSLMCKDKNFVYGISSRNVDEKNYLFLKKFVQQDSLYLTFSDIWVNANYDAFNKLFFPTLNYTKKDIIIITNPKANIRNLNKFIKIKELIPIIGNCVTYWEKKSEYLKSLLDLKASLNDNVIFLVAAGPLTNIIINKMWKVNQNNIYLDIGSTLDPIIFNRKSRNYHKPDHPDRKIVDQW
ncbi:DUF1792 domain-containing protein [Candidatus Magnetomoraceae bacterium gMMP-15]